MPRYRVLLLLCFSLTVSICLAAKAVQPDSLSKILRINDADNRQKQLIGLCYSRYLESSRFDGTLVALKDSLAIFDIESSSALWHFAKALLCRRKFELDSAKNTLLKATALAQEDGNDYLLYNLHLNMAYVQTDRGDDIGAVHSYRMARKQAEGLNNAKYQVVADVGISDIYMHVQLYKQALTYLEQAEVYCRNNPSDLESVGYVISNKAEVYFKLGRKDSLDFYISRFKAKGNKVYDAEGRLRRLQYFSFILNGKFSDAIRLIKKQLMLSGQYYKNVDSCYLAKCYYKQGHLDSAGHISAKLINNPKLGSPQIKLQSYQLLAQIAEDKHNYQLAHNYGKMALAESEDYRNRMIQIADLSSEIRLEQLEASYQARTIIYKKERTILVFAILSSLLIILIIGLFYRSARQKRRYENLIYQAKTQELAFINSHEVRKHLANILGLCHLLTEVEPDTKQLEIYHQYLLDSALQMDESLKSIEERLSEERGTNLKA